MFVLIVLSTYIFLKTLQNGQYVLFYYFFSCSLLEHLWTVLLSYSEPVFIGPFDWLSLSENYTLVLCLTYKPSWKYILSAHYSGVNQDTCRNDADLCVVIVKQCHVCPGFGLLYNSHRFVFNRPSVARAVLQSPLSLNNSFIHSLIL